MSHFMKLPLRAEGWRGVVVNDDEGNTIVLCPGSTPDSASANAAFIVKAVNCHDELVAALIKAVVLLDEMAQNGPRDADAVESRDQARDALAKAQS